MDQTKVKAKADEAKSFTKRHWRALLNIAVVVGLVGLAYAVRGQVADSISRLTNLNVWFLLLLIPLEFFNYDAQARLYRSLYRVVGERLSYWFSFKLALELNFINLVFPSGGISGITYIGARMRIGGKSGSRAVLMQMMKLLMTFLSFELVLAIGLLILASQNHAGGLVILIAGALTTATVLGTLGFIFIITSQQRVAAFSRFSAAFLALLAGWLHLKSIKNIDTSKLHIAMLEMHENYKQLEKNYRQLQPAFWQSFIMNMTEVLAVFAVFLAFGHVVNIGAVILAYAVANLAGVISVLPGGAGVFEILMTGVLVIGGVPAGLALPAVVIYRLLNTALQLPPGYYYYQRGINVGSPK